LNKGRKTYDKVVVKRVKEMISRLKIENSKSKMENSTLKMELYQYQVREGGVVGFVVFVVVITVGFTMGGREVVVVLCIWVDSR